MKNEFRFKKMGIVVLILLLIWTGIPSISANESDFEYVDHGDGTATITGYSGSETDIVIPAELAGLTVTHIGVSAFSNKQLASVTFPSNSSLTHIGADAFHSNQLTSLTIPSGVINIGKNAFFNNQLSSVTIPDGLTSIGENVFYLNQLTNVTIPDSVTSLGYGAFSRNQLTSVTIPDSITKIGDYAFNNNQLTNVIIPDSVTSLGYGAFANNKLTSVTFSDSLTRTGEFAFYNNELTSLVIPGNITRIDEGAFRANELTNVTIPNSVTILDETSFAENQLTNIVIPGNVTTIGIHALAYNQLTSVTISEGVTHIGDAAFDYNELTSVFIPSSVVSIGSWAFDINKLTHVTIAGSPDFGRNVFASNPSSLTLIGYNGSSVPTYAQDNQHNFQNVLFAPDGSDNWAKSASSEVLVFHRDEHKSLHYVWTTSAEQPDVGAAWQPFNDHDELMKNNADNDWYLHIRATGEIDGVIAEHSQRFRLDNTPPQVEFSQNGSENASQQAATTVTVTDDGSGVDENSLVFIWSQDRDTPAQDSQDWTALTNGAKIELTEEVGNWYLHVQAEDQVGNQLEMRTERFRLSPPLPEVNQAPDMVNTDTINITGTAYAEATINITGGSENVSEKVDVNGDFAIEVPLNKNTKNTLQIRASVDEIESEAVTVTIVHDDVSPQKPVLTVDPEGWTKADEVHVTIKQHPKDDDLSEVTTIRVKVGDDADAEWVNYAYQDAPINLLVKAEGETTIQAQASDQLGNKSAITVAVVQIDRTAPELTLRGDQIISLRYGAEFVDPGYDVTDNFDANIKDKVTVEGEVDTGKVGLYELTYFVQDQAGNRTTVTRTVNVNYEEQQVITLNGDNPVPIYPGSLVKLKDTHAAIQLPHDLPEGTMLNVKLVDISVEGYEQAGETFNFIFTYPEGQEDYTGTFSITLGVDQDAENIAIYYYNEHDKTLEYIGGEVENGLITATVEHFSTYGVFNQVEKKEEMTPPQEDKQDDPLPNTATNVYNWLLSGGVLLIIAATILWMNRKRKRVE